MMNRMKPMFSPREYAKIIGVSESTVRRWIYKKKIKTWQVMGRKGRIFIPRTELPEALRE